MDTDSIYAYMVQVVEEDKEYHKFIKLLSKYYPTHKRDIDEFILLMKEFQEEYRHYNEQQKGVLATAFRYLVSLLKE
jgi:uncharacterized tellurite resistance protein B-like protein